MRPKHTTTWIDRLKAPNRKQEQDKNELEDEDSAQNAM